LAARRRRSAPPRGLTALFTGGAEPCCERAAGRRWPAHGGRLRHDRGGVLGMPLDTALLDIKAGAAGLAAGLCSWRGRAPAAMSRRARSASHPARPERDAWLLATSGRYRVGLSRWLVSSATFSARRRRIRHHRGSQQGHAHPGGENVYPVEVEACR
jgi:hypothetical protein